MSSDEPGGASPGAGKPAPIAAKDVASATALGAATRLGLGRRKSKVAEGAAAGGAGSFRRTADRSGALTAMFVVVVMVGTLVVMLLSGR
jgi:hypothetical protein